MKEYHIPFSSEPEKSAPAVLDIFRWEDNGYQPETEARLSCDGEFLYLLMTCREKNPLARFTADGSPVCRDSCMEFFFAPDGDCRYCNIEINANGCCLTGIGASRYDRIGADFLFSHPVGEVHDGFWCVKAVISTEKLKKLYGTESIGFFTGNFYKCGDETEFPHYGMWSEAVSDTPDFHRPECFGRLIPDRPIR